MDCSAIVLKNYQQKRQHGTFYGYYRLGNDQAIKGYQHILASDMQQIVKAISVHAENVQPDSQKIVLNLGFNNLIKITTELKIRGASTQPSFNGASCSIFIFVDVDLIREQ